MRKEFRAQRMRPPQQFSGQLPTIVRRGQLTLLPQDLIGHCSEQGLLVGDMPVQRAGLDVQQLCQPSHRQVLQPVVVQDLQTRCDDVVCGE